MIYPEWFVSVPIFQPVDPVFCLATYFCTEDEEDDGGFTTKKYVADWYEDNDLEFIQWYKDYQILYDWEEQRVMVSGYDQAWETASINLYLINVGSARWETEKVVVDIAKKFIDALESAKPSKGQLELQLTY